MTDTSQDTDAQDALSAFVEARHAAEAAIQQCQQVSDASSNLQDSAQQMAQAVQACEQLLTALGKVEPILNTAATRLTEEAARTREAFEQLSRALPELEQQLAERMQTAVSSQLGDMVAQVRTEMQSIQQQASQGVQQQVARDTATLRQAQEALHRELQVAVETVRKDIKPAIPPRLRWGGIGQILSMLVALLTGAGFTSLLLRPGDPYAFEQLREQWLAAAVAGGLALVGVIAFATVLVALLRREPRWWLSTVALLLGSTATAISIYAGIRFLLA